MVKRFNPGKGFGFIVLVDRSGVGFLHGAFWRRMDAPLSSRAKPCKFALVPAIKGHTSPRYCAWIPRRPLRRHDDRALRGRHRTAQRMRLLRQWTVKWFNAEKGCGFIALVNREQDVFVHISALERSGLTGLTQGPQVVVEIGEGRKGPEAVRVRLF